MTLQQLRSICEVVASGCSVSRAAQALHTSQPAVSKLIKLLEQELGAEVFVRAKGRITGLTEIGEDVFAHARRILHDSAALTEIAAERYSEKSGVLRIGTTHLHARYALLEVITAFTRAYPEVHMDLTQGNPEQIADWVAAGTVHLGISTLPGVVPASVLTLPAYAIERCIITPLRHPLLRLKRATLRDVARYPLITYDRMFNSGSVVQDVFGKTRPQAAHRNESDRRQRDQGLCRRGTGDRRAAENGAGTGRRQGARRDPGGASVSAFTRLHQPAARAVPARLRLRLHRANIPAMDARCRRPGAEGAVTSGRAEWGRYGIRAAGVGSGCR